MSYGAVLSVSDHAAAGGEGDGPDDHRGQDAARRSPRCCARRASRGSYLAATRHSPLLDPRSYGAPRQIAIARGLPVPVDLPAARADHVGALVADQLHAFRQSFATVNWATPSAST